MFPAPESHAPTPDLPLPLPDPAVIDAAAEEAHYAADKSEAQAVLRKLAMGNADRVSAYRTVGADPRIRQWTDLLRKVEGSFPTEHIFLLENVGGRVNGATRWLREAAEAEEAERQIPHLSGPECRRLSREHWMWYGEWNATIDRMVKRLQILTHSEAELRTILDNLEVDVRRVLGLYADDVARRAGSPPVTARAPIRSEPRETVLDFDPRKTP